MKKIVFFSVVSTLSFNLMAANYQIPNSKTIVAVHAYLTGATFTYEPSHSGDLGCTGTDAAKAIHIDWSQDENYKAMYSAALAAYSAGKTVGFGVSGCIDGYGGNVPKAYRVDVKN